jgi:hypothetical protein
MSKRLVFSFVYKKWTSVAYSIEKILQQIKNILQTLVLHKIFPKNV